MSKFDVYVDNIDAQINIGTGTFGSALAGSLPVDSRLYQVSVGGTFTSINDLGFFNSLGRGVPCRYKITGVVINFKKTKDDRS